MRVAHLVDSLPLVQVGIGRHVDHEPALLELEIVHRRADRGTDQAVGAVAAQDEARRHPVFLAAGPIGEGNPGALGPDLDDLGHLRVGTQHRVRMVRQVRPQQPLDSGWSNILACG